MLGLFEYRYDRYEFENIEAVSESKELLKEKFKEIMNSAYKDTCQLVDKNDHINLRNFNVTHYYIKEIEYLIEEEK